MRRPSAVLLVAMVVLTAGCGSEPVPPIASAAGPAVVVVVVTPPSGPGEPVRPGQRHRLDRDAQRLLDRLSELPELPDGAGCDADTGNTLELTVRRPGAQQAQVRAEAFGCEVVTGWGEDRTGGKDVERLVLELLEGQQVASPARLVRRPPTPAGGTSRDSGRDARVVRDEAAPVVGEHGGEASF